MDIKEDRLYSEDHEWLIEDGDECIVGITDFAQSELGDVVFVNLPEEGDEVYVDEPFGDVESVKAVSDLISPVTGIVCEINEELFDAPELVNEEPYDAWMIRVEEIEEKADLMTADEYEEFLETEE